MNQALNWTALVVILVSGITWIYAMSQIFGLLAMAYMKGIEHTRAEMQMELNELLERVLAETDDDDLPQDR